MSTDVDKAAAVIAERGDGAQPSIGIVLGSGLGGFADAVETPVVIPYADLPGFPEPGVSGHAGRLLLGEIEGTQVAVLQGRAHYYENGDAGAMKTAVRSLRAIGCDTLLLTNSAGSTDPDMPPGSVMRISDHINFAGVSPLFGDAGDDRFVDLSQAYDPGLGGLLAAAAEDLGLTLHEGVYMWFCGPHFETPAEIRAARLLGAAAIGMSTVPEVILARQAGLNCVALSIITNFAAGMDGKALSHAQTKSNAAAAAEDVTRLLRAFLARVGG